MVACRALVLAQRYPPDVGGLARSGARIAAAIAAGGGEVDVLAWTRTLPAGELRTETAGAVTLHRLGAFRADDSTCQHTLGVLEWLHGERDFEVVWGHYLFPAGFLAVLFGERSGVPSVASARGNDVDRMMLPPGDFARLGWTLERATRIAAVSEDLAGKIRVLSRRSAGVVVVPNAVDAGLFAPGPSDPALRAALGIEPDEAVLAFSGELRHKKGLPFLLEAFRQVREQRPACLLVIGEVRARELEQLHRFGAAHPAHRARIVVTGYLEQQADVVRHLRLADVFVMPSLWDGMPNAVLEAMACGACVLASDAGGIPEIVRHGETGFTVPRAHLHRLGEAALELLALPVAERVAYGRAARAWVVAARGPATERETLAALLTELMPSTSR